MAELPVELEVALLQAFVDVLGAGLLILGLKFRPKEGRIKERKAAGEHTIRCNDGPGNLRWKMASSQVSGAVSCTADNHSNPMANSKAERYKPPREKYTDLQSKPSGNHAGRNGHIAWNRMISCQKRQI
jgi:hypothetical protein